MRAAIRVAFTLSLFTAVASVAQVSTPGGNLPADEGELRSSRWITTEAERASAALAKTQADVIVAPFSVDGDSFDAIERSLLARTIAAALRQKAALRVADVTLVERAVGAAARSIPESTLLDLAKRVGAHTVVQGRIAHDNAGHYHARVETVAVENGVPTKRRIIVDLARVAFGDTNPPLFTFRARVDDIVAALASPPPAATRIASGQATVAMPTSIEDFEQRAQQNPIQNAYLLQLLGVLHPKENHGRERQAFFERSLIALDGLPANAATRALRARAWANLNRRPLALAALGSDSTEEIALRAYLDGDMERLSEAVGRIKEPLAKLLATFELERSHIVYHRAANRDLVEQLAATYPYWAPILAQSLATIDSWGDRSNTVVKLALDAYWPMPQYDLEGAVRAAMALQKPPTDYDITKLSYEHSRAVGRTLPTPLDGAPANAADVLVVLEQMLVTNVADGINDLTRNIGKPDVAIERAAVFEPLFSGQPDFVLARGWAEVEQSGQVQGPAATELRNVGYEHLRQGAIWSQGQHLRSEIVLTNPQQFFPGSERWPPAEAARRLFLSDWPNLPEWGARSASFDEEGQRRLEHCVAYAIHGFQCFMALHDLLKYNDRADDAAKLVTANRARFVGHPQRIDFLASLERDAGNESAASAVVDEAIASGSMDWGLYWQRGVDLAKQGKPREALAVFLKYPGFTDPSAANRVALSNHAYEAGSHLYWAGAYEEARPLYEFAAGLETGSEASLTSASRLALLDGDLETAAAYTAERARRYANKYSLRDLMMFVAALGDRETAWAIFNTMQQQIDKPDFWVGAMAIQRMEGATLEAVATWAVEGARATPQTQLDSLATRHIFLLHVTDRDITDDLAATLSTHDPGPKPTRDAAGIVRWNEYQLDTQIFGDPPPARAPRPELPVQQVEGRLTVIARGLAALQRKDYEAAFAIFDGASRIYHLQEFLPYYAWAAANTGRTERVEHYLTSARETKERIAQTTGSPVNAVFEESLSQALLRGYRGEIDIALDYLVKTNATVLHTEERSMFTRYQIAEVAELLYEHTRERRYRDFMLDLARRNSVIDPAFSWPHAFVGKYSENPSERRDALARALYLDPLSRRALSASPADIESARRLIAVGNPLVNAAPAGPDA